MTLTVFAYAVFAVACVVFGRKLYDSLAAGLCLGLFSPCMFSALNMVTMMLLGRILALIIDLFSRVPCDQNSDLFIGASSLLTSVLCSGALAYFAETEAVKSSTKPPREPVSPPPPPPPSDYDSSWK